jgi:uncharacterized protein (TIGR02646 family)
MRFVGEKRQSLEAIPEAIRDFSVIPEFDLVLQGQVDRISHKIYKGEYRRDGRIRSSVREALALYYKGKCAYCENIEKKAEIEHYRPKKGVNEASEHPGYFWLCYEWTNLLPSCRYCNTEGGKGNQFPIMGVRTNEIPKGVNGNPDYLQFNIQSIRLKDEKPYLLHPEVDNPKLYFKFDAIGKVFGIDAEGRGDKTIKICNLNRDNLLILRQSVIDDFLEQIKDIFFLFLEGDLNSTGLINAMKRIFKRMEERQSENRSFTLLAWYVFENFDKIFLPLLPTSNQKEAALNAYISYRNGQL